MPTINNENDECNENSDLFDFSEDFNSTNVDPIPNEVVKTSCGTASKKQILIPVKNPDRLDVGKKHCFLIKKNQIYRINQLISDLRQKKKKK
ncbi:hypothetical protein HHI36_007818 [Cryptolaemus montrouzieri]|uniref:Uncharacterized protein n=1 Tax=Cryptolaemus montrouzieri TaxID=559131 RepID=A0ABD2MQP5_9CUCU